MKHVVVQFNFRNITVTQYDGVWGDLPEMHIQKDRYRMLALQHQMADCLLFIFGNRKMLSMNLEKTLMPFIAKQDIPMLPPKVLSAHYVQLEHTEMAQPAV